MQFLKKIFSRIKLNYGWKIPVYEHEGNTYPLQGVQFDHDKTILMLRNTTYHKNAMVFYDSWKGRKVDFFGKTFKVTSTTGSAYGEMTPGKTFALYCHK